jgi:hypothetical protein
MVLDNRKLSAVPWIVLVAFVVLISGGDGGFIGGSLGLYFGMAGVTALMYLVLKKLVKGSKPMTLQVISVGLYALIAGLIGKLNIFDIVLFGITYLTSMHFVYKEEIRSN